MTTYTLAYQNDLLTACIPDGGDLVAALREEGRRIGEDLSNPTRVETGLILTDEPRDDDEIVQSSSRTGWLTDEKGHSFGYAVKRK